MAIIFLDPGETLAPPMSPGRGLDSENPAMVQSVPFDADSDWGADLSSDEGLEAFDNKDDGVEEGEGPGTQKNQGQLDNTGSGIRGDPVEHPILSGNENDLALPHNVEEAEGKLRDSERGTGNVSGSAVDLLENLQPPRAGTQSTGELSSKDQEAPGR